MPGCPWSALNWKWEQRLRKLSVTDQVLAMWLVGTVAGLWCGCYLAWSLGTALCLPPSVTCRSQLLGWLLLVEGQSSIFVNGYCLCPVTDSDEVTPRPERVRTASFLRGVTALLSYNNLPNCLGPTW